MLHPHPGDFDLTMGAQPLPKLACVLLDGADVLKLQFQLVEGQPVETGCSFQDHRRHPGFHQK